ncbi:MAG: efflux RND transporter periplasmic adaptor subunit [Pseudodesulfovibrio sp.]|uniref:Efflux transporter, RND family, MFP subunit n=1 Tax=Pseudodesulfovibrio aespoeensis (strain ATCC 700646 / DSM 10631 / Aspo-2) TaxID=643562 RepID=E6VSA7_PSEA9|nr:MULTISPECIES: efflux RND transporter periplasmic adaptor subunit [Pseudodesulfovibrio]MBU4191791.1 efflux RND transporter periplasmic adaptor subunit [Pseudomonadota bacterium]ADU64250.1 efflux transporter, RND family, MFP subunit [Pseudodesulfovibrio aespoeensis Aspo-2]MBU4243005.1 efflux RND transporter periplasmic adaptor subunit [Pseudomonadota bacterium]MBU4380300.1 efflux RND transporter periplasmic adaptor subunit [Pseudomonadota bacterium]MBU4475597.1 efflux RND transporter periplas
MTNILCVRSRLVVLCFLCLLPVLPGCGPDKKAPQADKSVPVTVVAVVREDVDYTLGAVGNVVPLASVEIKSRVGGIIEEQLVVNGQDVRKGDLLFRIDPRSFDLAVLEAEARLARDRAHLVKARENLRRYSTLRDMNVVAQQQYDDTYAEATALENTIRLNEATLAQSRLDREYAAITAPISGRVGIIQVNEGNVIKANDDRTLCVINQIRPINISFALPERFLGEVMDRLAQGEMSVEVTPSGSQTGPVTARLAAVDNAVDTATGTIRLLAAYHNDDNRLWPGQFARVDLTLRTIDDALLLPTRAVMQGLGGSYVYVIRPDASDPAAGVAEARDVVSAHILGERTVVSAGVAEGELVVLDGQVSLAPGAKVSIRKASPDAMGAAVVSGTAPPAAKAQGTAQ